MISLPTFLHIRSNKKAATAAIMNNTADDEWLSE